MRTTYFHFIDGEVGIGTTYHTLPQQGYTNEFGVGVSSYIGIGTENAKVPIQITDFSGTGLRLEGIGSDYVGMQLKTLDSSDTLTRNIFIDTVNELGNAIANQVGSVQSDGGSHWRWETQPPGDRTDRRVERLRITGLGSVGIGSDNPVTKLDVFGNIRLSDINPEIQLNFGGPRFRVPADNTLTMHNGGDSGSESHETVRILQSGNVGIGTITSTSPLTIFKEDPQYVGVSTVLTLRTFRSDMSPSFPAGGSIKFDNYDGNYGHEAFIEVIAPESHSGSEASREKTADFNFKQTNNGTLNTRFTIKGETGNIVPGADNTQDLGSSSLRWANVYTGDMHLNNMNTGGNEVDGSEGHWTLQEGSDDLFLINRNTGKKYKFNLTEVS